MDKKEIYSYHSFMFPFRFDFLENGMKDKTEFEIYKEEPIEKRVDVKKLFDKLQKSHWMYKKFTIDISENYNFYNEFVYFYDYVRSAIYNLKKEFDDSEISYFFEIETENNKEKKIGEFSIYSKKGVFNLDIVSISLRIFTTGVGILSIELENRKYFNFDDILLINDYGRRIYPPFLSSMENPLKGVKDEVLPDKITVKIGDKIDETENFDKLLKDVRLNQDIKVSDYVLKLLDMNIFTQNKKDKNKFYIQPILDDRMFVLCWYGNDVLSHKLKTNDFYNKSDGWYKYIFIDSEFPTVQNDTMKKFLLNGSTYKRWSKYGTFYGVSRYSFVCLTDRSSFSKQKILMHMKTMYYQMTVLLLALRASILRFSDEIAALVDESKGSFDYKKLKKLYEKYLTFYNRLYFKEISSQDQGIELYDMAKSQMRIDEHINKLDNKFTKLFEFANMKLESDRNDRLEILSILGFVFLPPALLASIYGMNIFSFNQGWYELCIGIVSLTISGGLGFYFVKFFNKKVKFLIFFLLLLLVIITGLSLIGEKKFDKNTVYLNYRIEKFCAQISSFTKVVKQIIPNFREKSEKIC